MNEKIARVGSLIVSVTVVAFAVCVLIEFGNGSFFICTILPIGFIMLTCGFYNESENGKKIAYGYLQAEAEKCRKKECLS